MGVVAKAGVKSADRALRVVEALAENGRMGFNEILRTLELPRSSGHGLLLTLVASGWVAHDPDTREYSLGLRAWQVGQRYTGHRTIVETAEPIMERLVEQVGETAQLARLDGTENVYIAIRESGHPMRIASDVGSRLDAHATAIGKALFSMLPRDVLVDRLTAAAPLKAHTVKTVTMIDELLARVDRVQLDGYALDDEEALSGVRCVAVPLTEVPGSDILTAMSVTMPSSRTDADWPTSIVGPLQNAAAEVRRVLGVTGTRT